VALDKILFLDLETTGFDPATCHILEIGMLLVDAASLEVEAEGAWQIKQASRGNHVTAKSLNMSDFVRDMHTTSGLLDMCDSAQAHTLYAAETQLLDLCPPEPEKLVIAGYSAHFDRDFIRAHMPSLSDRMHYRLVNVSTFRECAKTWGFDTPQGSKAHRALPDCHEALDELRFYKHLFDKAKESL